MDLFTMARPGALLRIMLLLAVLVAIGESYTSHYCYKTETIREAYNDLVCYSYGPYCCWRWVIKYREVVKIKKVCCPGWTSCYCHRPICKPRCQERGVCVGPDDCYCRNGATGTCKTAACTTKQDCYPGTCPAPGDPEDTCQCSSGYEGTNCEKITDGPTFQSCSVQLVSTTDQQNTLLDQKCGDNIADNFTVYSNNRDYDLLLNWKTTYDFPPDILSEGLGPTYLLKYAPGIVDAHASVKVKAQNDEIEIDFPSAWVSTSVSEDVPRLINVNSDVFFSVNKAMKHLDVLDVELFATTGGHKELHDRGNGGGFIRHYFSGEQLSQRVRVVFDLVKPVHCSADSSCEIGDWGFPLKVEPDITKDNVTIIWSNWNDTDSGIGSFSYEIFPMGKNQNGQLSELTNAVASGIWEDDAGPPTYSPTTTGMYSVILTVTDQAGNENKARSLFLYDPVGHLETTASGISVSNGNEQNSLWINSVQNASNGNNLEVTWKDHFVNRFYIDNDLLGDVALFTAGEFDDTDGNRTTVAITSNNGVQNFQVGFTVAQSADSLTDEPSEWKDREQLDSASLSVMRQDGDHVRIFVKATDVAQFVMVDTIDITVDSSAPELNSGNTMFNVNAPTIYPLPKFASTVNLNIVDEQSGLSNIDYDLYEVSARQQENKIQTGTQNVHTQEKSTRCTLNGDCYCLRTGTCYTRTQAVYLNNCWFMNRDVNTYRLKFQVRNGAGLTTLGQYDIPDVTNLDGEGECLLTTTTRAPSTPSTTAPSTPSVITSIAPDIGILAGGTRLTLTGQRFPPLDFMLTYGNYVTASSTPCTPTSCTAMTPPAGQADDAGVPFQISVTFGGQKAMTTPFLFTYKANPQVNSIRPLKTLAIGGTTLTVTGAGFDAVNDPELIVTMIHMDLVNKSTIETTAYRSSCVVNSAVTLKCPTPELTIPKQFEANIYQQASASTDQNADVEYRWDIDGESLQFVLGFSLDGDQSYTDLSASLPEYAKLSVFVIEPEFDMFDETREVSSKDRLRITGRRLTDGLDITDYVVTIGTGSCTLLDATTTDLICVVPEEEGQEEADDEHSVLVQPGLLLSPQLIGVIRYKANKREMYIIIGACVGVGLILIIAISGIVAWRCRSNQQQPQDQQQRQQQRPDLELQQQRHQQNQQKRPGGQQRQQGAAAKHGSSEQEGGYINEHMAADDGYLKPSPDDGYLKA